MGWFSPSPERPSAPPEAPRAPVSADENERQRQEESDAARRDARNAREGLANAFTLENGLRLAAGIVLGPATTGIAETGLNVVRSGVGETASAPERAEGTAANTPANTPANAPATAPGTPANASTAVPTEIVQPPATEEAESGWTLKNMWEGFTSTVQEAIRTGGAPLIYLLAYMGFPLPDWLKPEPKLFSLIRKGMKNVGLAVEVEEGDNIGDFLKNINTVFSDVSASTGLTLTQFISEVTTETKKMVGTETGTTLAMIQNAANIIKTRRAAAVPAASPTPATSAPSTAPASAAAPAPGTTPGPAPTAPR